MLRHTALEGYKKSKIAKLSASQKRKVSIILALVGGPKVRFFVKIFHKFEVLDKQIQALPTTGLSPIVFMRVYLH